MSDRKLSEATTTLDTITLNGEEPTMTPTTCELTDSERDQLERQRQLPGGDDYLVHEMFGEHVALYGSNAITTGLWECDGQIDVVLDLIDLESGNLGGGAIHGVSAMRPDDARRLAGLLMQYADAADRLNVEAAIIERVAR